jgi:hypothetical protein
MADILNRLRTQLKFCLEAERQLPLSPMVTKDAVAISDIRKIPVNKGLVSWIDLSGDEYSWIHLLNPTEDKVKPDVHIFVLNRDGVVILEHRENWRWDTLDFNKTYTCGTKKRFEFPEALVFSKWGAIGWDIEPAYVLCVGSKTSYDNLVEQIVSQLRNIRETPPIIVEYPYRLQDVLPEVAPFSFGTDIAVDNSVVVKSVFFSKSEVRIAFFNRSDMRISPTVKGCVFNKDGVIIGSFEYNWGSSSLSPNQRSIGTKAIAFSFPEELVFSRWAHTTYDIEPAWLLVAGSSKQFQDLKERTAAAVKQRNSISVRKR